MCVLIQNPTTPDKGIGALIHNHTEPSTSIGVLLQNQTKPYKDRASYTKPYNTIYIYGIVCNTIQN